MKTGIGFAFVVALGLTNAACGEDSGQSQVPAPSPNPAFEGRPNEGPSTGGGSVSGASSSSSGGGGSSSGETSSSGGGGSSSGGGGSSSGETSSSGGGGSSSSGETSSGGSSSSGSSGGGGSSSGETSSSGGSSSGGSTSGSIPLGCTYTQGYWKTHAAWPAASLQLGSVAYSQHQLQSVFDLAPSGNGLVSLAHQLIAAKLNVASGASSAGIASTIAAADARIGDSVAPPIGSGFIDAADVLGLGATLQSYNEGMSGVPHCL